MQVGKGSVYGTLLHHITPSRSPHNALHFPSKLYYSSVEERPIVLLLHACRLPGPTQLDDQVPDTQLIMLLI